MSESFDVVTDDLTGHASTLDDLAGQLNGALDTAKGVDLTPDAFGEVGQGAVPDVQSLATSGQDALRTQVAALQTASTDMRATAANYQQQDVDTGTKLSAISGDLPPQTADTAPQAATGSQPTTDTPTTDTRSPAALGTQVAALHPPNIATDAVARPPAIQDMTRGQAQSPTWNLQPTDRPPVAPEDDTFNNLTIDEQQKAKADLATTMGNRAKDLPPGAAVVSETNQSDALHGVVDGTGIVVARDNGPALQFVSDTGEIFFSRDLISVDPSLATDPGANMTAFSNGMKGVSSAQVSNELWVQVPDGTSRQQLQNFMNAYVQGEPGYTNVTVYFRDTVGNDIGMVTKGGGSLQ
jgi:hypothetical protein